MKFDKNSWHVKLNKEYGSNSVKTSIRYGDRISLCEYFWSTVVTVLSLTAFVVVLAAISSLSVYVAICTAATLFSTATGIWFDWISYDLGLGLIVFSFLVSLAVFIVALFDKETKWLPVYITKYFKTSENTKVTKQKDKPNLFVEWIKAKKAKVCPLIEIE